MKKLLFALGVSSVLCGCNMFLPDGKAPEGAITDNASERDLSPEELENNAVTSLTAFLLTHPDITGVSASDPIAERVLKETVMVTGTHLKRGKAYALCWRGGVFQLYKNDRLLIWQYPEKKLK